MEDDDLNIVDTDNVKRMDIKEFREIGFLQEVNRCFLHPLGLALEVFQNEDGTESLGGIWDYRDDPEGMIFSAGVIDRDKVSRVLEERMKHLYHRMKMFRNTIQDV